MFDGPADTPLKRSVRFVDAQNMWFDAEISVARIAHDSVALALRQLGPKQNIIGQASRMMLPMQPINEHQAPVVIKMPGLKAHQVMLKVPGLKV